MSLMDTMNQRAMELGVPFAVHFDVTYRCNERCIHCYLDHDDHGEMTTSEIKGLLDQIAEAGTFLLTFSGGEIFMRRDIFELLEYARRLLFNVKIKTNAVMIRQAEAERLLRLGIDQIQISIYSHRLQERVRAARASRRRCYGRVFLQRRAYARLYLSIRRCFSLRAISLAQRKCAAAEVH